MQSTANPTKTQNEKKAHVVYAAAHLAKKLHKGQKDKGGNDYFQSHLLRVGTSGSDWREKVVGFLHDAAEDTGTPEVEVIRLLKETIDGWLQNPDDKSWTDEFDGQIAGQPTEYTPPTDAEWDEIFAALLLLNHHTVPDRGEYISRIKQNPLATKVKLNDLACNMDMSRIPNPTPRDYERLERYKKEFKELSEAL